ncbi:hypothetical protein AUJ77_01820 [Candidatus Nomurabacteria bacterium CG1_02_43_90]|uniref:Uncharacterized protein n=1 Tax=Candidatus Nomurabacteria bacterium CG1_02_43_90 TaxID=1805281 RepID=A0A1J4V0Q3_9BACT|nr:MAG: hypothetical protein AUJ77_01820 [Candidatus Nomurabacteria bacterium CG1_02_43_90]
MVDVLAKNTSCEDELREWRNTAPVFALGSEEIERIYRCRLDEILYPDAVVEAATCKTVGDIEGLLEKTNLFYAGKRKIYGERRKELIIADAVIKASTRTSSEQAKFLRFSNGYGISEVDEVYRNRWIELANAEAPAKAATCKTVGEAEKLFYDAPNGSEAKMIYEYRCMELF